jgi:adenosylmethionine-8-amino-7-oxononanoate aminotransferase
VLLRPIGNTVYFMPPYVIDADEIALLTRATLELLPS